MTTQQATTRQDSNEIAVSGEAITASRLGWQRDVQQGATYAIGQKSEEEGSPVSGIAVTVKG